MPVKVMPKGLEGVGEGFKYMREGKVSPSGFVSIQVSLTRFIGQRREDYLSYFGHAWLAVINYLSINTRLCFQTFNINASNWYFHC
jgi:hypothetical protein